MYKVLYKEVMGREYNLYISYDKSNYCSWGFNSRGIHLGKLHITLSISRKENAC